MNRLLPKSLKEKVVAKTAQLLAHIDAYNAIHAYVEDYSIDSDFREGLKNILKPYEKQFSKKQHLYSGRTITQDKFCSFLKNETMELKGRHVYSFSDSPKIARSFFGSASSQRASVFISKEIDAINLKKLFNHLYKVIEKEKPKHPALRHHHRLLSDYMNEEREFLVINPIEITKDDVTAVTWGRGNRQTTDLLEKRRKIFDTPAFEGVNKALKEVKESDFLNIEVRKTDTKRFAGMRLTLGAKTLYEGAVKVTNKPKTKKKTPVKDNLANKSVKPKDTKVHWWDRLNKEQQVDYLKQFPKSKFKVNKT